MQEEQEERAKRFLAIASHDLQSPLRHIAMYADILIDELADKLEPDQAQSLRMILEKAQTAQRITKSLIAYAAGAPPIKIEDIDIETLGGELFEQLAKEHHGAAATIAFAGDRMLRSDGIVLSLALKALIENALLHAGKPDLALEIKLEHVDAGQRIMVSDNGRGIEPAHRQRIFDAFWKGPQATGRPGLGLAIATMLLSELDGSLTVETSERGGACFTILLPQR